MKSLREFTKQEYKDFQENLIEFITEAYNYCSADGIVTLGCNDNRLGYIDGEDYKGFEKEFLDDFNYYLTQEIEIKEDKRLREEQLGILELEVGKENTIIDGSYEREREFRHKFIELFNSLDYLYAKRTRHQCLMNSAKDYSPEVIKECEKELDRINKELSYLRSTRREVFLTLDEFNLERQDHIEHRRELYNQIRELKKGL